MPRVLCISGLDPSGRAGLLADVGTVLTLGGRPLGVASALTAQGEGKFLVAGTPSATLRQQFSALLELGGFEAVKLGMIPGPGALQAILELLEERGDLPWVVDPVAFTSKGQQLSKLRAKDYLLLARDNVVLTPNLQETSWLSEDRLAQDVQEASASGARILAKGFGAVVVKGGHLSGKPVDLVCTPQGVTFLPARRLKRKPQARGTGCRFGSALAVFLAQGAKVGEAAAGAKGFVEAYLRGL